MNIDLANVPPVPIQIGVAGENAFRTITFDASTWGADFPDATYTVVYKRSGGYIYPVLVNAAADAIVWSPTDTDTAVSGNGQIEVRLLDGETIGKTIVMQTFVAPSLSGDESEPSTPAPDWVNDVAADADRAEAAVSHYPQIVNGVWFVWDATQSEFVSTGISAQGEDGVSPTVTVTEIEGGHRVTITDADGAHTFDVMDGQGGSGGSETVVVTINDTTDPMTASMTAAEIKAAVDRGERVVARYSGVDVPYIGYVDNTSIFAALVDFGDMPTTVAIMVTANGLASINSTPLAAYDDIPTSQEIAGLAPVQSVNGMTGAVTIPIPTVPTMATDPNMSDWASGKTVDAAALKTDLEMFDGVLRNIYGVLDAKASASDIPTDNAQLVNGAGYQTAQDVHTAIANLQTQSITDTGGYYSADTVDGALQEIGAELAGINTLIGSGVIS